MGPSNATGAPAPMDKGRTAAVVVATLLALWALRAGAIVAVPLVFSVFLTLLVRPLDRWSAAHLPRRLAWLGHLVAMGAICLVLVAFVGALWLAAQQMVERFPLDARTPPRSEAQQEGAAVGRTAMTGEGASEIGPADAAGDPARDATGGTGAEGADAEGGNEEESSALDRLIGRVGGAFGTAGEALTSRLTDWAAGFASAILGAAGTLFGAGVLIFFLTLLMLIEAPQWSRKIATIASSRVRRDMTETLGVVAGRLRRYLLVRTVLGILTAALYWGWLWVWGLDLLLVWVLLAFLFNYIPNLGSLIAGGLVVLYAYLQMDLGTVIAVALGILAIEQVVGNFIDPWVQGRQVAVSPLVVLVALMFWTFMWGVAGAFLAVPITIAILIAAAQVEALRPLALLLSSETDEAGLDRAVARHPD